MLLPLAQSGVALLAAMGVGLLLEEAASRELLWLHLVPIGPSPLAADLNLDEPVPRPFGEHGWIPIPLALLDLGLVLASDCPSELWRPDSWWGGCAGSVWAALPTLAVCVLTILPATLAAWLLWMPWQCTPLPLALAAVVALLSVTSLLFWSDLLPLLPRARAEAGAARRGARRAWLSLLHPCVHLVCTSFFHAHHGGHASPTDCAATLALLATRPAAFAAAAGEQMQAQSVQAQASPVQLATQVAVGAACVFIYLDISPRAAAAPRAKAD